VRVKICGLTRAQDAAVAVAAGADYLGVVFAGGPRRVTPQAAAEVRAAAGGVTVFGVFGDQAVDEILRIGGTAGLGGAQLHGTYRTEDASRLRAEGLRVWRVARLAGSDAILVEPWAAHATGGTGIALDHALAREARARLADATMVLAGGLTPETVAAAVALVRPDIVDVSSGVERLPGIKDPHKIARFLEAVVGHSAIS
jgi:phosphoribosylanthranilate isomerase